MGILTKEKKGNLILFNTNKNCSFLQDLKSLFEKIEGIITKITDKIRKTHGITYALIFGSAALGRASEKSDIDILVIGSIEENNFSKSIFKVQKKVKREINFILWTEPDLKKKIKEQSTFLKNIATNKYIWIKGDMDEFIRITK
ncbi:MAG: nucleotidyltransferase domain-containing protein [Candidatus Micrarchaeota archaeon]